MITGIFKAGFVAFGVLMGANMLVNYTTGNFGTAPKSINAPSSISHNPGSIGHNRRSSSYLLFYGGRSFRGK